MVATLFASLLGSAPCVAESLQNEATKKVAQLENLMEQATAQGVDIQREECAIWMAKEFLLYADWDEENYEMNVQQYKTWQPYAADAERLAQELPTFEREEVVKMLDTAIEELSGVIEGRYTRRSVPKIDWENIQPQGRQFVSNNHPVFVNDYFTKPSHQSNEYLSKVQSTSLALNAIKGEHGRLSPMGEQRFVHNKNPYSGYVLLWHGAAPQWISEQDPHVADGMRLFTHYDIDNPLIRKAWHTTFEECVPLIKQTPLADMGYILSNEPHWFTKTNSWATGGVSAYTIEKFRLWLSMQHNSIEEMNNLWGSSFASFEEVEITIPLERELLTTPMGYDWQRFNMDRVTDWFTFLDSTIKQYDPEAKTHIKNIPHFFSEGDRDHGIDFESLYELTDIVGNDAKIIKRNPFKKAVPEWEKRYAFSWYELAIAYDFLHSVNPNAPNVNSESHFLSASTYRDIYMTKEFTRSAYWLATLHGMNLSYSWFWAREEDGSIRKDLRQQRKQFDNAMNSAYVASVVQQPRVANEVTKTYMDINAFGEEMAQIQSQRRPIRLFYSENAVLNNAATMESLQHLYEQLYFEGTPLGYVTQRILNKQDNNQWDVVLVWDMACVAIEELDALQAYLDRGGVVVVDNISLKYDPYKRAHTKRLQQSNGRLITATSVEEQFLAAFEYANNNSLPMLTLDEKNSTGEKGCMWRTIQTKEKAYLLSVTNLGKSDATLTIGTKWGKVTSVCEQLLGKPMKNEFVLPSEETILVEVTLE